MTFMYSMTYRSQCAARRGANTQHLCYPPFQPQNPALIPILQLDCDCHPFQQPFPFSMPTIRGPPQAYPPQCRSSHRRRNCFSQQSPRTSKFHSTVNGTTRLSPSAEKPDRFLRERISKTSRCSEGSLIHNPSETKQCRLFFRAVESIESVKLWSITSRPNRRNKARVHRELEAQPSDMLSRGIGDKRTLESEVGAADIEGDDISPIECFTSHSLGGRGGAGPGGTDWHGPVWKGWSMCRDLLSTDECAERANAREPPESRL